MAFSFDMDIYSWLLEEVLKVSPSGDPVNDAVYLILLPMVVLYMYADFVISKSRFMGSHGKFKYIMMFVVGFVIVREGYYAFFASMSLPLLGLIMIWHAFSFIMGWGHKPDDDGKRKNVETVGFQPGSGGGGGLSSWLLKKSGLKSLNPIEMEMERDNMRGLDAGWAATEVEGKGLRELPPNIIEQRKSILDAAIKIVEPFRENDREKLINGLNSGLNKELKRIYGME